MSKVKSFEIDKSSLENQLKNTSSDLEKLKKLVKNKNISDNLSFKIDEDGNLYLIDGNNNILIDDKTLKQDIEKIYKNLQSLQTQVNNNPTLPKTEKGINYVTMHLDTYDISTLFGLYNKTGDTNLKKSIETTILSKADKNNFKQNKELLKEIKKYRNNKNIENIYEKVIFTALKKLSSNSEGDELINLVGKKEIQNTIKNQVIIDDSFAEDFYFNFHSPDNIRGYSINCKNNDKVACNSFSAYLFAMQKQNKLTNLGALGPTLLKSFDNNLTEFKTGVLESINKYKEVKGKFPPIMGKTFEKAGISGVIDQVLAGTKMDEGHKESLKALSGMALGIGLIVGIFKLIKKTGFKGLLALVLGSAALEYGADAITGESFFADIIPKFLNNGFVSDKVKKTTQQGLDFAKYNEDYDMGKLAFLNTILGDEKIGDMKGYLKENKDGKLKFDTKKYLKTLKKGDWRIQLIKGMGEKNFAELVINGLAKMGIKTMKDLNSISGDERMNTIFANYQKIVKQQQQAKNQQKTSNTSSAGVVGTTGAGVVAGTGGSADTGAKAKVNKAQTGNQIPKVNTAPKNVSKPPQTIEFTPKQKKEILSYFGIENNKFDTLNKKLKDTGINLDIFNFLNTYKEFIEANLSGLKKEYKDKIKLSIKRKLLQLPSIINERIDFVDEQISKGNYKKEDRAQKIKNQRWIINAKMQELFSDMNNKILPSVEVYLKYKDKVAKGYKFLMHDESLYNVSDKIEETEKMLDSKVLENGDFDKTWKSFEIIDANTNNWNIFDSSMKHSTFTNGGIDGDFLKRKRIKAIKGETLLSKKDIEIQEHAQAFYMAYVAISVIPYLGAVASVPSDIADTFSDTEGVITILKGLGVVDKNYTMEKSYWDNIFGGVGLLLTFFGFQGIAKERKLVKAGTMLDKLGIGKIKDAVVILSKKLGIPEDKLEKITGKLKGIKKGEKLTKNEEKILKNTGVPFKAPEQKIGKLSKITTKNSESISQINKKMQDIGDELLKRAELNKYYNNNNFRKQRIGEIQNEIEGLKIKKIKSNYKDIIKDKNINNILKDIETKKNDLKNTPAKSPIEDQYGQIDNTKRIANLKKEIETLKKQLYESVAKKIFVKEREDLKESLSVKKKQENLNKIKELQKEQRKILYKKQTLSKVDTQKNEEKVETSSKSSIKDPAEQEKLVNKLDNKSEEEVAEDIKSGKIDPKKFSESGKFKLFKKLLGWPFNKEFKSIFSGSKKEISGKLIKFVITGNPNVKMADYNVFKEGNGWKGFGNLLLTGFFAYITWGGTVLNKGTLLNTDGKSEFHFKNIDSSKIDWKDIAENYIFYGMFNRFLGGLYMFNEIGTDLELYKTQLFDFIKVMPHSWVEEASKLPGLGEDLKNFLSKWLEDKTTDSASLISATPSSGN